MSDDWLWEEEDEDLRKKRDEFFRESTLRKCQRRYESGQREALMDAIRCCILGEWPAPPWLRDAFREVLDTPKKSWDEVFDSPIPKGAHRRRRYRNLKIGRQLKKRIEFLHEKEGRSINRELFEDVGKEFGVGGSVARDLYYEDKKLLARFVEDLYDLEDDFRGWLREREGK
jgi:hypothetical protein